MGSTKDKFFKFLRSIDPLIDCIDPGKDKSLRETYPVTKDTTVNEVYTTTDCLGTEVGSGARTRDSGISTLNTGAP